jgi:GTP-binding protein HflX
LFFERPNTGEKTILVHVDFPEGNHKEDPLEFKELVHSSGAESVDFITASRKNPDPKTFIGKGKVEEIGPRGRFSYF